MIYIMFVKERVMAKFNEFGIELPDNYEILQEDELAALADGYEDMA